MVISEAGNLCLLKVDVPPEASPGSSTSEVWALVSQLVFLSCLYSSPLFSEIPLRTFFTFAVHNIHRPHAALSVHCILLSLFFHFLYFSSSFLSSQSPSSLSAMLASAFLWSVAPGLDSNPARGQSVQLKGLSDFMQGVYMGENLFIWEKSLFWYLQNSLNCWWTGLCGFAAGNLIRAKAKSPPWLSSVTVCHVMWWDVDGLFYRYCITHIKQQPQVTKDIIGSDRLMLSLSLRPNSKPVSSECVV